MTTTIQLQSEQGLRGKQQGQLPDHQWLKTAEKVSVWGAVVGMAIAATFQQPIYTLPLSLHLGLSLVNRKHEEAQMQQRLTIAMNEVAQLHTQSDRFSPMKLLLGNNAGKIPNSKLPKCSNS